MKVLIIGLGSIAKKHIDAIKQVNPATSFWAIRHTASSESYEGIINVYSYDQLPVDLDFAIISNPTSKHTEALKSVLKLKVPVMVEKPISGDLEGLEEIIADFESTGIINYVACNLRFHPCIKWLKDNLSVSEVLEVRAYCGSYLPDWRPGVDYRKAYSSVNALGGGVHLDLIHELDYLVYLFGLPGRSISSLRKVSRLEIESMDSASYLLEYSEFTATVGLNYFRRKPKRSIDIVTNDDVFMVDLLNGTIETKNSKIDFSANFFITDTYKDQMKYFLSILNTPEGVRNMNTLKEAFGILKLTLGEDAVEG